MNSGSKTGWRVLVICGMTDKKLHQKIAPIQAAPEVDEILLLRRRPYHGAKIRCYSVPPMLRMFLPVAELWRMIAALRIAVTRRPDVSVCMTLLPHGIHGFVLKALFRIPLVFHIMGKQDLNLHDERKRLSRKFRWKFSLQADVIVTRGRWSREKYVNEGGVCDDRVFVQQNVFDFDGYAPDASVDKVYDLVYVGYLEPYKSVDLLVGMVPILREKLGKDVRLLLVGDGSLRGKLEKQAHGLGVGGQVTFAGRCNEEDLVRYLRQSRLFVMTSLGEGLPQAMIEAMACGIPPVLFDDADVRDIVRPGENGILVPPVDTEAFVEELARLLADDDLLKRLSAGANRIREEMGNAFSMETQRDVWRSILKTALEKKHLRSTGR